MNDFGLDLAVIRNARRGASGTVGSCGGAIRASTAPPSFSACWRPAREGFLRCRARWRGRLFLRIRAAWNEKRGAFTAAGIDDLDASVLLLPEIGLLAIHDPRFVRTVEGHRA
jgi:hypothetical protein